jgi:hypothetical protein
VKTFTRSFLLTLALIGAVLLLPGCATDGFTKVVEAIHEDPASSELTIQSPWGVNIVYKRTLPANFFTPPTTNP